MALTSRDRFTKRVCSATLGIALALAVGAAPASPAPAATNDCVPTEFPSQTVDIVKRYLTAFVTHDIQKDLEVPLAADARRTTMPPVLPRGNGGPISGRSGEQIRAEYYSYPTTFFLDDIGGMRIIVDGCAAVAFAWMDFQVAHTDGVAPDAISRYLHMTIHVGERFWISEGLIKQVEVLHSRAEGMVDGTCWPAESSPDQGGGKGCAREPTTDPVAAVPGCKPGDRETMIAAANSYIQSLKSREASGVPLAETARRTEMPPPTGAGPVTGTSANEIRASIEHDPRFDPITDIRDVRWTVEPQRCQVVAHSLVDIVPTATTHHITRFMVSEGLIHEIEDIWVAPVGPGAFEGSCWPQAWSDVDDETYRLRACPAA